MAVESTEVETGRAEKEIPEARCLQGKQARGMEPVNVAQLRVHCLHVQSQVVIPKGKSDQGTGPTAVTRSLSLNLASLQH